jgi:dTMP kinase
MEAELSADRGLFITVEGIEGAGKSTHINFIVNYLRAAGHDVVATREPGGTALGETIRSVVLQPQADEISIEAEALLMFAARAQHIEEVIEPALARGSWIVCDRFTEATYAYQGGGRGMPFSRIAVLEEWVQGALRPDLTLLLDISPEVGLERVGKRGGADRFDAETKEFFENVRNVYLRRAAQAQGRYAVIDAEQTIEAVRKAITDILDRTVSDAMGE